MIFDHKLHPDSFASIRDLAWKIGGLRDSRIVFATTSQYALPAISFLNIFFENRYFTNLFNGFNIQFMKKYQLPNTMKL